MLLYCRYAGGPVWSEALIVVLAAVGFVVAVRNKGMTVGDINLLRFIAFYALIMTAVYSAVPYKTPWCLLGFLHGMILLAAVGAAALVRAAPNILPRLAVICVLAGALLHLTWQAHRAAYKLYADPRNPYVYAHPGTDVFVVTDQIKEIASVHPEGNNMQIQVVWPEHYWPLPWYLRRFPRVWWWTEIDETVPPAPVIIASASVDAAVRKRLAELNASYVPLFNLYKELRPGVELRGYVEKELWDRYQQHLVDQVLSKTNR